MAKILSILFLLSLFGCWESLAQGKPNLLQLSDIEILDTNLIIICDSIFEHEKACPYYNKNLLFNMSIFTVDDTICLYIESWRVIYCFDTNDYSDVHCFEYKNTIYLVNTNSKKLFDLFFKKTGKIKKIPFERTPFIFDYDGMSYWYYKFINNQFISTGYNYGYCDDEKKQNK